MRSRSTASLAAVRLASEHEAGAPRLAAVPRVFTSSTPALLLAAAALTVGASALFGGGSSDHRVVWIGGGALVAAGTAVAGVLVGRFGLPRPSRLGVAFVGLLAAFVVLTGFSVLWSIAPDRSWAYFNRGLAYLAFALLGLFVGAHVPRAPRAVAVGLAAVVGAAVVWALAGKVVPALASESGRIARLRSPVGYWNALALLLDFGLPLALWLAATRRHTHAVRAVGVLFLYALIVALLLTYSRGGVAVAVIVIAAWLVLGRPRLESAVALLVAGSPAAAVALWAFTRPGIAEDLQPHSARVHDGAWFGLALVLGAAAATAAAFFVSRFEERRPISEAHRQLAGRAAAAALAVAVGASALVLVVSGRPSNWFRDFTRPAPPTATAGPARLATISSTMRWYWWKAAWRGFEEKPALGSGAASFELTNMRLRQQPVFVTEPHNLPLQFLSETGILGLLLGAGAIGTGLVAAARAVRRLEPSERMVATALLIAGAAYVLHSLVDFDWDFVAVTAPFFVVLGVLAAAPYGSDPPAPRRRPLWALGTTVFVLAALYSLAAPWLADRKVDQAYSAIDAADPSRAAQLASDARRLDSVSIDPIIAAAAAAEARGDVPAAERLYLTATKTQPDNWRTWYEVARFEVRQGDMTDANTHLQRAIALNPLGRLPYTVGR